MAEKQKMQTPSGIGGLVRYDEGKSKIQLKPEWILGACVGIIILEIILFMFF